MEQGTGHPDRMKRRLQGWLCREIASEAVGGLACLGTGHLIQRGHKCASIKSQPGFHVRRAGSADQRTGILGTAEIGKVTRKREKPVINQHIGALVRLAVHPRGLFGITVMLVGKTCPGRVYQNAAFHHQCP